MQQKKFDNQEPLSISLVIKFTNYLKTLQKTSMVRTQLSVILAVCLTIMVKIFLIRKSNYLVWIRWFSSGVQRFSIAARVAYSADMFLKIKLFVYMVSYQRCAAFQWDLQNISMISRCLNTGTLIQKRSYFIVRTLCISFSIIRIYLFLVQVKLTASYVNRADLRRAAIHLLQSMLALPLHFANMPIKVSFTVCWVGFEFKMLNCLQCSRSMTFLCGSGSGSANPCLWIMDPDPDPAIFVIDLQDANK